MFALAGTVLSVWSGLHWHASSGYGFSWSMVAWAAAMGFALSTLAMTVLGLRPAIDVHDTHLQVGRRKILWNEIRRVDQTGWSVPLAVQLTLASGQPYLILYPGDLETGASVLRQIRRYSRYALIDGIPYKQFWGEALAARTNAQAAQLPPPATVVAPTLPASGKPVSAGPAVSSDSAPKQLPPPRYPLLRPEDEEEVERLFQRLKTAGRLDRHSSDEE
jgi:hypothetical protein